MYIIALFCIILYFCCTLLLGVKSSRNKSSGYVICGNFTPNTTYFTMLYQTDTHFYLYLHDLGAGHMVLWNMWLFLSVCILEKLTIHSFKTFVNILIVQIYDICRGIFSSAWISITYWHWSQRFAPKPEEVI